MDLQRTRLKLQEYGPYGPSLKGFTKSLPFGNFDMSAYRNPQKLNQEREEADRRRNRLREIALEQWSQLVADLQRLIDD